MDCYTANWYPLGEEAFYRKLELYSMEWGLREDLRDCVVAAAPYGGPIALLRNSRRDKAPSSRPLLEIYSASGLLLASVPWKSGRLVHLGWTAGEDLLCIQEDGTVLVYNLFCEFKRHFSMGNEVLQNHVLEAQVFHTEFGTGVAILTGAFRFSLATNIDDLKLRRLPEVPGLQQPPACWAVLSQDRVTVVLLAVGPELFLLDNTSCSSVTPPGLSPSAGPFLHMAVSFNHRLLALFCDSGYIWMGLATLKEKLCEFNSTVRSPPKQMVWCTRPRSRQRAVVVAWERQLMVVGNSSECIRFVLDEDSHLVPELDGVRILSRTSHEFLHEIPEASQEIFRIASMAPGALLLEAQKEYEKESQKADEYLREIREQQLLPEAVGQCIEAAGYEHEPQTQKSLLRAASFGKCFLDKFPPESFVRMCQDLRVLNAIRDYQIGIPLTFTQYKQLTIEVLLDRLVLRRLYPLAIRICEFLRLPEIQGVSRILAHWACSKVQQKDKSDEEVAQAINQKLGDTPGISYSEIATRAYDCGRAELAIKLLEYEPRSGEQVPLLLKMKRSKLALGKAIESGDTDLVYTVVLHLKNELNRGTFFMTLQNQPVALSLYRQFCRHQERDTLKDLYNQDDNHQELGNFHVHSSYSEKRIEGRVGALQNALDEFNKARNDFAAKATEEQIKLLRLQRHLQEDFDKPYLDLSLHDTVSTLILDGHHKRAEQLYREFRIPDKRYWWLKINALATRGDWEEMEKFSKSKKSPIGYLPFVEVAVKHHNRYEARKYAPRVPPEQRVKAFVLVGDLEQAAEAAIEHKSEAEMNLVLSHCSPGTNGALAEKLTRARAQLLKK
ncbi:vacuolar protein sorting-associated protein 16 homolog [Myiozetetes cayanensis]|uniref:vacuolar protein sorting-associated protein 16 homolog n=1 Tax=Myiozetetes cayanensis TaxID=478635 RepID=UPI00215FF173|nr:vacuolar protein sorting-associated protein 16 homolog [Myiozetetes cayanensis]